MKQTIPVPASAVNRRCAALWADMQEHAPEYGIGFSRMNCGAQVMDAGLNAPGSFEVGRLITELSQGGLARATLSMGQIAGKTLPFITVESLNPMAATLSMQMACSVQGVMCSGPIRLLIEEPEYVEFDLPREGMESLAVAVLQPDAPPEESWVMEFAKAARVEPDRLRLILVPQDCVAGCTQIAGRSNENIILTLVRSMGYAAHKVRHILGTSPICPVYRGPGKILLPDDLLHYAGESYLTLEAGPEDDVQSLAQNLCFASLDIYGSMFADLLEAAGGDFYKIPNISHINKLARVCINDLSAGKAYCAGEPDEQLLLAYLAP